VSAKVAPIQHWLEAVRVTTVQRVFCLILSSFVWQALLFLANARAEAIRLAYSSISGAMASLWVAQDYGYFRHQGLDVQLLYIGGGSVATQALIGGDVQFVRLGANSVVQASLRGASLKMIANTINTLVFSLMARPEIQAAKDLKGKKIGLTRLGGSTDFALDLALKKWGLRRGSDVAVIQTGGMRNCSAPSPAASSMPAWFHRRRTCPRQSSALRNWSISAKSALSTPIPRWRRHSSSWKKIAARLCDFCAPIAKAFIGSERTKREP
jgi:NMT1/THI5 like